MDIEFHNSYPLDLSLCEYFFLHRKKHSYRTHRIIRRNLCVDAKMIYIIVLYNFALSKMTKTSAGIKVKEKRIRANIIKWNLSKETKEDPIFGVVYYAFCIRIWFFVFRNIPTSYSFSI